MEIYVYDIETMSNAFTAVYVRASDKLTRSFRVWSDINELELMVDFLDEVDGLVGFNNLRFDYPVLHYILTTAGLKMMPGRIAAEHIYKEAQRVIEAERSEIAPWQVKISQRDLFRIHHYDNKARRTSLKMLQAAMEWDNLEEMPFHHSDGIHSMTQLDELLSYNLNDVLSTLRFYNLSQGQINMRYQVGKAFGLDIMNFNDAKIGESIMVKFLSERMNIAPKELRAMRTHRERINVADILLDYINFNSEEFTKVYGAFKALSMRGDETKNAVSYQTLFDGVKYDYGSGGLHAIRNAGIYESTDQMVVMSSDVASYYPNLAIVNELYPEHLGKHYARVYKELYEMRKTFTKGSSENYGIKIALNGTYGKSNDVFSPMYDPQYTMAITINGQLLLSMLCEMVTAVGGVIMANTDGIEVQVLRSNKQKYLDICTQWEQITGLTLEHSQYKRLFLRDVNNYIAEFEDGSTYMKGAYEVNRDFHKDYSMKAVRRAVLAYLKDGTPLMDTFRSISNLHEFCLLARARGAAHFEVEQTRDGKVIQEPHGKILRYYMPEIGGGYLKKKFDDGRTTRMHYPYRIMIANTIDKLLPLNYRFYVEEANKLIQPIVSGQLKLF